MKANELMIGDWVYNKNIDKPIQVYPMMFSQMFRQTPDATIEDYNIFPIPLTAEILEKNGFKSPMPNGMMLFSDKEKDISIVVIKTNNAPNCNDKYLVGIKQSYTDSKVVMNYVHQLQHHLRLCGIEKTIEL